MDTFRYDTSSYRPRDAGHDYHGCGTYLITLVVSGREPLLARLEATTTPGGLPQAMPNTQPQSAQTTQPPSAQGPQSLPMPGRLVLTPLGQAVQQAWLQTPARQAAHGNSVVVQACVCMPDHFHGVIQVLAPMQWSLGDIIQAFKAACTRAWQQTQGLPTSTDRPIPAGCSGPEAPSWLQAKAAGHSSEGALVRSLSKGQRQAYYAFVARQQKPLFDDNYDDTVCLDERHRKAMVAYVIDNPRRALLRRLVPDVLRRCMHVEIGGRRYGAFGNLFLLRWPRKVQVMCHRRHPLTGQPYETTADYAQECRGWVAAIMQGGTVIVTPGISRGELLMKQQCLEHGYPLIHMQKEPIGPFWKPELSRFEACARGALLILAPWDLDGMQGVGHVPANTDYSRFHNMNALAAEICAFEGDARLLGWKPNRPRQ